MDTAWALTPAALSLICAEIRAGREQIVECGSGLSTVAIGRALADRGAGRLYSLEHDPHWLHETSARLEAAGVADRVELLAAPLRPHPTLASGWYDPEAVAGVPAAIDLLLVDGPPGDLDPTGEARYPALDAFADRLSDGALVILDDAGRPGEQRVLERWQRQHPIRFARNPQDRFAIGVFSPRQEMSQGADKPLERKR